MAKNIDKDTVKNLKTKNIYSWLDYGESDTVLFVSDRLSSTLLNLGTADKSTEITVKDGSTNAYAKVIAGNYTYGGAASGTFYVPAKLTVTGVDANAIYGGAFIASKEGATTANSKYGTKVTTTTVDENGKKVKTTTTVATDITVDGNVDLSIAAAKVSSVYGGGAGYGSVLNGNVKISLAGTNNIGKVYGGGQTGAVVNGNVEIVVGRTDAKGYTDTTSRISAIYGGGYNAVVNGDVNITIDGANAVKIGTVSGSGVGSKSFVNGTRTLTIANYSGKFTATIKDFDNIIFSSGTSITLTQSQNKTIAGAKYEFVVDAAAYDQKGAILTWNKNIDVSGFSVTIADDLMTSVKGDFQTTIYSSSYLTKDIVEAADIKIYDANGDEVTGTFDLVFVADTDSRGNAKAKGGSLVLTYAGGVHTVSGELDYNGSQANDEVTVQTGKTMSGNINLGGGKNVVEVEDDAEVTGAIVVDKNSTNTIYVDGTISRIRGGDATTNNIVYLNSPYSVGYFNKALTDDQAVKFDSDGYTKERFNAQVLQMSGESNDTVYLSKTSTGAVTGIDFAKGNDTLVLNSDLDFSVTYQDGNNVVVANENGINIDASDLKLAGSNNVFVVSNGVLATINSIAIGDFMAQYDGIYLSQNAMAVVNGEAVLSSYAGKINLAKDTEITDLLVIAVRSVEAGSELDARIGEWYTEGNGVNATIEARNDQTITLNAGATVNGTIKNAKEVHFEGDADSDKVTGGEKLYFENTTLVVDAGSVATVGSIDGLDADAVKEDSAVAAFELNAAKLDMGNNARVVEVINDRTIVKDITEAAEFSGNVAFIGEVKANIMLTDAKAFFGENSVFNKKNITFVGANEVDVNGVQTLNNKKLDLTNGTVQFNVLDDSQLKINGLINGETLSDKISYTLGTNSGFGYGDIFKTASWSETFDSLPSYAKNIDIEADAVLEQGIDFSAVTGDRNIVINDGVEVTTLAADPNDDATAIKLGENKVTLTIGMATIDGEIVADKVAADSVITLNGTTVNTMYGYNQAITLGANGTLDANAALINGDVNGGNIVLENGTDVKGAVTAGVLASVMNSTVAVLKGTSNVTDSTVGALSGTSTVYGATTIGTMEADATVTLDGATATINAIAGDNQTLNIINGATVAGDAVVDGALQMTATADATLTVSEAAAQSVVQNATGKAGVALLEGEVSSVGDITQQATEGSTLAEAAVFAARSIEQEYDGQDYPTAIEPIGTDEDPITIQRTVGAITQSATTNSVIAGAEISADGKYEDGYHKPAQVVIDKIDAKIGAIDQTGTNNSVLAGFDFDADGESDIKVQGASKAALSDITQMNKVTDGTNKVTLEIAAAEDDESKLTLGGEVKVEVGAINQTSYKGKDVVGTDRATGDFSNEVTLSTDKDNAFAAQESITAKSIEMKAYAGSNKVDLSGNVEVTGDITVGGVLEGEVYEKYAWGDKAANRNLVEVDVDTVKVGGKVGLIGLENTLVLNNDAFYNGDKTERVVENTVYFAGKDNLIDIDAGVKLTDVTLADITDYDKVGKDGQDLDLTKEYDNKLNLRGEVSAIELQQLNSNDTINVLGGKIAGDVVTNNGNDTIFLGKDATTDAKGAVLGDSTIGGKVVMGTEGAANGTNTLTMEAFDVNGEGHGVAIGGGVEMYASSQYQMTDGGPFDNTLSLQGYEMGAKIGGSVKMVAEVAYEDDGSVANKGSNALAMGTTTTIDGGVTMTAFSGNGIQVDASEEYDAYGLELKGYAEITGQVSMTADENTIMVGTNATQAKLEGSNGAAAYMNGIEMHNTYENGAKLTGNEAENTITVGSAGSNLGSELIVGTSVSDLADVWMGDIVKTTADGSWTLSAVDVAERGHDVITYTQGDDTDKYSLTAKNAITVTGRFSAKDVTMWAKENAIKVTGNGVLQKDVDDSTDEVRTALFQAASITQVGTVENSISAVGTDSVAHYGYAVDPLTGEVAEQISKIGEIASVEFKSGAIKQDALNGGEAANTVTLTGSIVATTGDITQTGADDNVVTVETFKAAEEYAAEDGAPRSLVGNIAQSTADNLANSNTVTLTRTDVGTADGALVNPGTIDQFAVNDNKVTMEESLSGAIKQTSEWDNNSVSLTTSESGAIEQTAGGANVVYAQGSLTQASLTDEEKAAGKKEGDITYLTSEIKGDIVQTSTNEVLSGNPADNANIVIATESNIDGSISQTGINDNGVIVDGQIQAVKFLDNEDTAKEEIYYKAYDVNVTGDVTQKDGWDNQVTLYNASLGGKITQTGTLTNKVTLTAGLVNGAENKGVSPDTEYCSDHTTLTHVSTTIKSQADFNTQAVKGDIVQTAAIKDEDAKQAMIDAGIDVTQTTNTVTANNMDLAGVTQTQADGTNTLTVNSKTGFNGTLTKLAEYTGEIDESLGNVTYVGTYEVNKTTTLGDVQQTALKANTAALMGVTGKAVTQASAEAGNTLTVTEVADVTKKFVDVATWDGTKEVFTKTLIAEDSDNVRVSNKLGTIAQTSAATGNYADQVTNSIDLTNTSTGAVSQKATAEKDAGVVNTLEAKTTVQNFADLATTEVKDDQGEVTIAVGTGLTYDLNTENTIDGSIEQSGFENIATLTGYDVNGNIDQFASKVSTYTDHGDVVSNQKVGINSLTIMGTYNWNDAGETPTENYEAMGIERAKLTATVSGNVTQVIDDASAFETDSRNSFSAGLATITGTTYQEIYSGDNTVSVEGADFADITQKTVEGNNTVTVFSNTNELSGIDSSKIGKITQDGLVNSVTSGEDETAGDVTTGAITQNANGTTFGSNMLQNTVNLDNTYGLITETEETDAATITREIRGKAAAESITQTATAVADEEGFFADATNNPLAGEYNQVTLTCADAGDITQSGNARTANRVTANGATPTTTTITNITDEQKAAKKAADDLIAAKGEAEGGEIKDLRDKIGFDATTVEGKINAAIDIAKIRTSDEYVAAQDTIAAYAVIEPEDARTTVTTDRPNTLGTIKQAGLTNEVMAQDYATAGDLTQTSRTYATKTDPAEVEGVLTYTTQKDATGINNTITLGDVLSAGNVKQTVNAEEFDVKTFKLDAETETYVEDVDAATTGTVNGGNTFYALAAETKSTTVGDVTQEQIGKDGYAATGDNTINVRGVNLGNVDQDALAGKNDLTVQTYTTVDDAYSTKLGTVNQDGTVNCVSTSDVETKAIVQNANGLAAGYELSNSIDMKGHDELPSVTTVEGDKQVQRESLAAAKAESITQTINVFQNEDGSVDADETLRQNSITLSRADAGFVTQTGVVATSNYLTSSGATLTVQTAAYSEEYAQAKRDMTLFAAEIEELTTVMNEKVTTAEDKQTVQEAIDAITNSDAYKAAEKIVTSYETFVDAPNEYPNVIGPVTQIGTTNDASINDESVATKEEDGTLTAADIVQTSSTYATTTKQQPDQDDPASTIYTTSKYAGELNNTLELSNVATAGNVQQTVNAETFDVTTYKIDDQTGEKTVKSTVTGTANGTNTFTAKAATVGAVTQTGAQTNTVTLGTDTTPAVKDDAVTTGAITQTAAFEGTKGKLSNTLTAKYGSIASIAQTANGEYVTTPGENEGDPEVIVKNTYGTNKATLQYVDVTGVTAQTAAGATATNTLTATGNVTATVAPKLEDDTKPVGEDNKCVWTNGEYINSVGDVTQTLKSDAAAADYKKAKNTITLNEISAGNIVQDTTYVEGEGESAETVTTYGVNTLTVQVRDNVAARVKQYKYADDGYTAVEDEALKVTIGSVTQTGYQNVTTIDTAMIGAEVTEMVTDGEGEVETTKFVYGDITLNATSVDDVTAADVNDFTKLDLNNIKLTDVDVGNITTSNATVQVYLDDEKKGSVNVASMSDITLKNVTATSVTTGDGNDTLTIGAQDVDVDTTVISGTLDMGGNSYTVTKTGETTWDLDTKGEDKLVLWSTDAKILTTATVKNVEIIETHGTNGILDVAALEADDIKINTEINTLDAQKINVGKITDTALTKVTAKADAEGKLTTAVDYTFNDGTAGTAISDIIGSIADGDKIVIGDGVLGEGDVKDAAMENVTLTGFEEVTLNKDAVLNNVTWKTQDDEGATNKITIDVLGTVDATGVNIGKIDGYTTWEGADKDFTLKIGGQVATYQTGSYSDGVAKFTLDGDTYKYNTNNGMLSKA